MFQLNLALVVTQEEEKEIDRLLFYLRMTGVMPVKILMKIFIGRVEELIY